MVVVTVPRPSTALRGARTQFLLPPMNVTHFVLSDQNRSKTVNTVFKPMLNATVRCLKPAVSPWTDSRSIPHRTTAGGWVSDDARADRPDNEQHEASPDLEATVTDARWNGKHDSRSLTVANGTDGTGESHERAADRRAWCNDDNTTGPVTADVLPVSPGMTRNALQRSRCRRSTAWASLASQAGLDRSAISIP